MRVLDPKEDSRSRVELCSWCNQPAAVALHYESRLRRAACDLDGIHPRVLGDEQTGRLVHTEPIEASALAPRPYLGGSSDRLKVLSTEPAPDTRNASFVAEEAVGAR